ncbi:MAG: GH92 family glycosyl hydrolase, partial [Bacteroidales bacterium]|nr:GH92 family glycosyl hydrolase [Bacteroidales bacterium]
MGAKPIIPLLLYLLLINPQSVSAQEASESTLGSAQRKDLVQYVNPLMGTDSKFELSNGNTYPAIARPWGMNFWAPQTSPMGDGWAYQYDDHQMRGFKQTHQPSPWVNDYGAFSMMPVVGKLKYREDERQSWFSHKTEIVKPHYYKVYLAEPNVWTELATTDRSAIFRFSFPESDSSYIVIDAFNQGSQVEIIPSENKIVGYCRNNNGGVPDNFHNYFVAKFDKPFQYTHTWNKQALNRGGLSEEGEHVGAVIGFATHKNETVHVRVSSSFISPQQAELNLERELGEKSFEAIKEDGFHTWNKELNRIQLEGGTQDQKQTFYSCFYRTLLFPRKFYEWNNQGQPVHYSPYNGKVESGYMHTDNGFWDTFRGVFPFFSVMYRDFNAKYMESLVNTYEEGGWLPEWASPGYRDVMIGSNSASIIANTYMSGIRGYDIHKLYKAMVKNTRGHGPVEAVGRLGASYYNELGYVPYDVGINESAARTLEYAYNDYCIWQIARAIDRPKSEIDQFATRARNYRNLFSREDNLMRGRNKDGSFRKPFNPFKWGDAFTEGNSWHYTWSVFHDPQGLIDLMGGKRQFTAMLDSVFVMPPVFDESYYGKVIHEIREMQIAGMGQYAHGNQPIQHMIYLYNYAGQPWKAQRHVRQVMDRLYLPTPDGYTGDEDNGQTSAWYLLSAMGFYSVAPASNQFVFGSPLFNQITLHLENGNQFTISAPGNNTENIYIQEMKLNGRRMNKN